MRKKLSTLPDAKLREIAASFSIFGSKEIIIKELVIYFKTYNLNWADVSARFEIDKFNLPR